MFSGAKSSGFFFVFGKSVQMLGIMVEPFLKYSHTFATVKF